MLTRMFEYVSGKTINASLTTTITQRKPAEKPVTIFFGNSSATSWSSGGQSRSSSTNEFTVPECDAEMLLGLLKKYISLAESEPKKAGTVYVTQTEITFSKNTGEDKREYQFDDMNSFEAFLANQGLISRRVSLLTD